MTAIETRRRELAERIGDYLGRHAAGLAPQTREALRAHLAALCLQGIAPPGRGRGLDWRALAAGAGIAPAELHAARRRLRPGLMALRRALREPHPAPGGGPAARPGPARGHRPEPARPQPLAPAWADPAGFQAALDLQMRRHGDNAHRLRRALAAEGVAIDETTLGDWRRGAASPAHRRSFEVLARLEARWRLPAGYFRTKLPHRARAAQGPAGSLSPAERRVLAWHLPEDFEGRPAGEQAQILAWARAVTGSGATAYRRYQAAASRKPYALRFEGLGKVPARALKAPDALAAEVRALIAFKRQDLTPIGYRRSGVWGEATAAQQGAHLGLLFGALAAARDGPVAGLGAPREQLCLALLVLPGVWDAYFAWRRARRGFLTGWERNLAMLAAALTDPATGWLTQSPQLAERLEPIEGLAGAAQVAAARADWPAACTTLHAYARQRAREIARLARAHHEPFEAILPVLEAESPVGAYRRIAEEVLRHAPCPERHPRAAAESARAALMIRFGLHLGFRQRNLRELLLCPRGQRPRTERELAHARRGELRWSPQAGAWEVFAPADAFKNARSSFFEGGVFRLALPDLAGLYALIEAYLARHRAVLLGEARDPHTVFVKTARRASEDAAYDTNTFYQAWRAITLRYGVRNPWTGRGAIEGLIPHGPHKVRDVLATHVLKHTGSYEQASYAIQDTPRTVARHYGRFLPKDKAAIAAQVLNRAWAADPEPEGKIDSLPDRPMLPVGDEGELP
jgi:hypothetical protein